MEKIVLADRYCVLNHDIKVCERKLDTVDFRIKKLTMQKSPAHNKGLILPLTINIPLLIFAEIAGRYKTSVIQEAAANGIHNVDLGILDIFFISWVLFGILRDHTVLIVLVITSVYCFIRLLGRYGYAKTGGLSSNIAKFFGDINYNMELNTARKEYFQIKKELANLRIEKESIENQLIK